MSANPMGAPGCPELAFSTASMASARIAFALSKREGILSSLRDGRRYCGCNAMGRLALRVIHVKLT